MKKYQLKDVRNVGLIGHGGSGKTSVAEAILYLTGVSDRLGKVGDNTSVMDYDPDEVKRGHSVNASVAFCEFEETKINLIDTPGNSNFIGDTPACLCVVDGVVVVIGADDGVQFYTEKVWKWADEQSVPKIVFLNKMDHERAETAPILEALKRKFKVAPVFLQMPVGKGEAFEGIIDLVDGKFHGYEKGGKGTGKPGDIPAGMKDEVEAARAELVEAIAEVDDELIETYLEKGELSDEEFHTGLINGVRSGQLLPVLCGSATLNMGTDLLLKAMVEYLPSPDRRVPVKLKSAKDDSEVTRVANNGQSLAGLVFKTIADPYAGKLTLFRVFSGTVKGDSTIYNSSRQTNERVGQLFLMQGKKQIPVPEIAEGDIGTVAKLKVTSTGDSFADPADEVVFPPINFPSPIFPRALVPKTRADEEKISNALSRLTEEDRTIHIERNPETHELLISGMGQVHLDVILERLKRRFGVGVEVKQPKVAYRETIRGRTKVQGKYKKQTGGRGQFGDTWLEIEPVKKGEGFVFQNKIVGGAIPKTFIPAVEKGVQEAMGRGVIAHYPMVDVKVSLVDGSYHAVDSSEMAFKIAGSLGFKKGIMECKPVLLEPIMNMEVVIPNEYVGDIMGDLNSKRGKILGIDSDEDNQNIRVNIPISEVLNYAADLTSMTSGRGVFEMVFDHYDDVPDHIAQKIIDQANKEFESKD